MRSDSVSSADVASSNSSTVGSLSMARAIACIGCVCMQCQGEIAYRVKPNELMFIKLV
jgi:hypothetical protein